MPGRVERERYTALQLTRKSTRRFSLCIFVRPLISKLQKRFLKANFPLRKITVGSDRTGLFSILYYPHHQTKKVENTSTLYHRIIGSNWNRKLVPKAHSRGQFCSDPVLSHAYFPEWRPALKKYIQVRKQAAEKFA